MRIAFFRRPKEIPESFFKQIIHKVLKKERLTGNLEIVFLGEKEIQKLNSDYRGLNQPTDVLSFTAKSEPVFPVRFDQASHQIVICKSMVRRHSLQFSRPFREELAWALVHGLLHLCGYEHEKNRRKGELMRKKEEQYLKTANG